MKDYKRIWIYTLALMGVLVMILASCEKEDGNSDDNNQPPTLKIPELTTSGVSNITMTTATCGGNVTSDGGASVTVRGVCWSISANPTIADSHTSDGTGTGSFTSSITSFPLNARGI